jgi:2'-hydroxyisoflavone reductase
MSTNRRAFLATSAAALAASSLPLSRLLASDTARKKVLVMGGTGFLGPHVVDSLLAAGHEVVLFNRGKTNPSLYPALEKLVGDRTGDVSALVDREFDAVVDTNGYFPRFVRIPLEVLKDDVGQYVFVSTCSVYPRLGEIAIDESSEVAEISAEDAEKAADEKRIGPLYGALKVACEREAEKLMPGRVTVLRPGLIVGPGDPTDRFTYWPVRVAQGGEVLAPGKPHWETQVTDVRDIADFVVKVIADATLGVFNVDGLAKPIALSEILETSKRVSESDARFTWVDVAFLGEHGLRPWADLPAWFPPPEGADQVPTVSSEKAIAAGLAFRPLATTIADTLEFHRSRGPDYAARWTLTREKEAEVLAAWRARQGG